MTVIGLSRERNDEASRTPINAVPGIVWVAQEASGMIRHEWVAAICRACVAAFLFAVVSLGPSADDWSPGGAACAFITIVVLGAYYGNQLKSFCLSNPKGRESCANTWRHIWYWRGSSEPAPG